MALPRNHPSDSEASAAGWPISLRWDLDATSWTNDATQKWWRSHSRVGEAFLGTRKWCATVTIRKQQEQIEVYAKIAKGKKDFVHLPLSLRRDASRCWAKIPLVVSCRCAGSSGNCDNSRKSAMDITHMGYFLSRIVDTCPKDWILGALSALKASEMGSATTNCRQLRPMWWQTSPVPLHLIIWLCWDCEGVLLPNGHLVRIQA